jgi:hypothetical protein
MDELPEVFTKEEDKEAISFLLNWLKQLREHGKVSPEDYELTKKN